MRCNIDPIINKLLFANILGLYCFNNAPVIGRFVSISLFLMVFLQFLNQLSKKGVRFNIIDFVVVLFGIYSFFLKEYILGIWSSLLHVNVQTAITIAISCLLYISISMYAENNQKRTMVLNYVSICGFILATYSLVIVRQNIVYGLHTPEMAVYLQHFGLQSNEMGICFGLSFLSSMYLFNIKNNKKNMALIIINLIFMFLSGSRKSLVFLLVGASIYFLVQYNSKLLNRFILILLFTVICYYSIMRVPILYNIVGRKIDSLYDVLSGGRGTDSTYTRYVMFEYGIKLIKKKFYFGYGYSAFRYMYGNWTGNYKYSHNNYIELMVSGGLVLTIIFYLRYIIALLRLRKSLWTNEESKLYFSIILTIIILDFSTVSFYSQIFIIFMGVVSAYLKDIYEITIK